MDCLEFRRQVASEPARKGGAVVQHASECAACADFSEETSRLDQLAAQALQVPVPARLLDFSADGFDLSLASEMPRGAAGKQRRFAGVGGLALAASVVAAVLVSIGVWRNSAPESLGSELVAHVRHEPMSLMPVAQPVSAANVDLVLNRTGARVDASLGTVTYIETCPFRNRQVAHIVIEGSTGPVTLLLLPHIAVAQAETFEEDGFKGTIIPVGNGSVAIIGSETEPLDTVEELISSAVAWQI